MKCLVAVLLSVLATAIAAPKITKELTSPEVNFFDDFLDNKEFGPVVDELLKEGARICKENNTDLKIPLKEVIKRATELDQKDLESMTVCTLLKTKLIYITEPMVTTIDGCLPDDYTGTADFIVNVIVAVLNTICDYSVEEYFELFNPCTVYIDYTEDCSEDLERRSAEIAKDDSKTFPQRICSNYRDLKPCMEKAINKRCQLEITQKALLGVMNSVLEKPCAI